jgi:predicted transcriptional regulator YdeE
MNKVLIQLPEIKIVGVKQRTNNSNEMTLANAKIPATVQKYFQDNIMEKIPHRKKPWTTYSVYTEYASDFTGDYTYFIGEEVTEIKDVPHELSVLTIPAQHYMVFTSENGQMPEVCINLWQKIWHMDQKQLGGERQYLADFEIYDERAVDQQNTVLDIYIGIKS